MNIERNAFLRDKICLKEEKKKKTQKNMREPVPHLCLELRSLSFKFETKAWNKGSGGASSCQSKHQGCGMPF